MIPRHSPPGSPIYDQLVEEHGDVLNEARRLAEQTHREAERVLAWDVSTFGRDYREQS
ncbi:hypothetical protein AB0J57_33035 [Streptomyces sp. NPDC049837]|uniref:hypothetical protein n=1 Tax=Streptomyces sp. NPDC049837 TaxID=3155277 RepID=UPI00341235E9